jgi:hypothetical protein
MKISTRLALAFGSVAALALVILGLGLSQLGWVNSAYREMEKSSQEERRALSDILLGTESAARNLLTLAVAGADKDALARAVNGADVGLRATSDALQRLTSMALPSAEKMVADQLDSRTRSTLAALSSDTRAVEHGP